MEKRRLGATGPEVSAVGLGCMAMSDAYGPADESEAVATIRAALDSGVTLLDTGDFYGMGHNELLWSADRALAPYDFRSHAPRFQSGNVERNLALVDSLRVVAERLGATVAQVATVWVLTRGDDIVPLAGARTPERLTESLAALELELGDGDLAAIEQAIRPDEVHGSRYAEAQMAHLDSEA